MGLNLPGRKTDDFGSVIFTVDGLVEHLMRGGSLSALVAEESPQVETFNRLCQEFDHPEDMVEAYAPPNVSVEEWDREHQAKWLMPESYQTMNVLDYLRSKCSRSEELERVELEWQLFMERDMHDVLRFLVYMIDNLRERKIVWGVGRGSSVASYSLYLIGVHRVDSLRFGLDPHEFLK